MSEMTEQAAPSPFTATAPGARQAIYAALAATGPVHRIRLPSGEPAWLITRQAEVRQVLGDRRFAKDPGQERTPFGMGLPPDVRAMLTSDLLHTDPPDHTRLRKLVTVAFTRRRVELLALRIEQIAAGLLDDLRDTTQTELIASFAYPLPIAVICELLGIPEQGRADFRDWSGVITSGLLAGVERFTAAASAMIDYIRGLLADKRNHPADDLVSALVAVRDGSDQLTEDELISMVFLLLVAGHETTVNLIGNGVLALLTHPDQLALLRAEPERLPAAVEELLRFEGPVQVTPFRMTTEPVEVGGSTIPAGEIVLTALLAANRDPAGVAEPDVLDFNRRENPHLAFGFGIHHCLGAPLARLEGRIAIGALLARFPALRLAVPPEELSWRPSIIMHGLAALPVTLR